MNDTLKLFAPIQQTKTASERVAERLRELIARGNLKPGEKLPSENELTGALQVSRPVVREALRGLAMMGLVEARKGGGCYVTDLSAKRLMEPLSMLFMLNDYSLDSLFDARELIDAGLAGKAALKADKKQKARLMQLVPMGHRLVDDPVGFRVMDAEFHGLIAEATENDFLVRMSQALYSLAIEQRRIASGMPGVLAQSAKDHEAIATAIDACDAQAASQAMRQHVRHIYKTTLAAERERT